MPTPRKKIKQSEEQGSEDEILDNDQGSPSKRRHQENASATDDSQDDDESGGEDAEDQKPRKRGRPPGSKRQKVVPEDYHSDEYEDPEDFDAKGEEKVTKDGFLTGGREYRFPTFTLPRHPTRLYLFTMDVSKLLEYRDTYIFYKSNPHIKRIFVSEEDREFLRIHGLLPTAFRTRPIAIVTARNMFRLFGHRVIRRGRPVRDDYYVGDKTEPEFFPEEEEEEEEAEFGVYDFARNMATQEGGPFIRHATAILGFRSALEDLEPFEPKLSAIPQQLASDSWMLKCSVSAADYNRRLVRNRPTSFLDLHTNVEQVPKGIQPTRVIIEAADQTCNFKYIEDKVHCKSAVSVEESAKQGKVSDTSLRWLPICEATKPKRFPVALTRSQHSDSISLYSSRFKETDSPYYIVEGQSAIQDVPFGLPQNMHGVVTHKAPKKIKSEGQ